MQVMETTRMDHLKRKKQGWEVYTGMRNRYCSQESTFLLNISTAEPPLEMVCTLISNLECSLYQERFAKTKLRAELFLV